MEIETLLDSRRKMAQYAEPPGPIVISSRIRLARNLSNLPFPGWAKTSQRMDILAKCQEAIAKVPDMESGMVFAIHSLSELDKQVLVERHLISRELATNDQGAGLIVSQNQRCSIMVNEEDHLRIQIVNNGFRLRKIWKAIDRIDSDIESELNYAFSSKLGYLTACPTNLGTGMRASVMMHLPALVIANLMEKVIRAVNQLGIAVRGLFGEGSDASGSIFQISNQQTLGETESDIIKRLSSVLNTIIEQEENARAKLIDKERVKLCDRIGRAYGTLQNGHILSSAEAMNYLSLTRLAIDLNIIPEAERIRVDKMFMESQPGHIQYSARQRIQSDQRDVARATYLREQFKELPPLSFDNLLKS